MNKLIRLGKHGMLEISPTSMRGTASFWCDTCSRGVNIYISGGVQVGDQTTFQVNHRGTQLSYISMTGQPTLDGVLVTIKTALKNTECKMKWMP